MFTPVRAAENRMVEKPSIFHPEIRRMITRHSWGSVKKEAPASTTPKADSSRFSSPVPGAHSHWKMVLVATGAMIMGMKYSAR